VKVPFGVDRGPQLGGPKVVGVRAEGRNGLEPRFLYEEDVVVVIILQKSMGTVVRAVYIH